MKTLLILGAGTGGTMMANKMAHELDLQEWKIIIVDKYESHYYQPGFLFIPFGIYNAADVTKRKRDFIPPNVELIFSDIERIEPDYSQVKLTRDNKTINYDLLVIATGTQIHPEETEGLFDGGGWHQNIFDFYTLEGAVALSRFLKFWKGGRLVVNVAEMPIKCPVAPLEFLFLADWYFHQRNMRDKVEIVYA
ncbi:MAG: NAD(P)/FAD-dependent oxidoreductase, partial [Anaerolineales bacterium]|nr:NAD(P)/FAD-dependent oxidoreductase [Anaerolineales bacterium]